jgi:hypothetical protein
LLTPSRTFCTTFGYPSTSGYTSSPSENDRPQPFQPTGRATSPPIAVDANNAIFGRNELEAVAFFNDMINLTRLRDKILNSTAVPTIQPPPEYTSALLRSTLRDTAQGSFSPSAFATSHLRASISDLAHYNGIQVIAVHLCPPASLSSGASRFPSEAVLSARATLQVVLETRTKGKTMCLWMWMYYAFTAAVVLFLHVVADPLNADAVLDLALLDELKALCEGLGTDADSEGAKRVWEIVDGMGRVAWEVVKRTANRRRRRRRGVETEEEPEAGGSAGESTRSKRLRSGGKGDDGDEGEDEGEGERPRDPGGEEGTGEAAAAAAMAGTEVLNLENVPQNFEWEQWDQWLEDAPFEVEEE